MNVCTKFHGNPSNSFWDNLLKTKNLNLTMAPEEKSGDPQINQDSSSGDHDCLYKILHQSIL